MRIVALAMAALWIGATACTGHGPSEPETELQGLEGKVQKLERDIAEFNDRLRAATGDPGLRDQLSEEEELMKSRLERLREKLKDEGGGTGHGH